MKIKLEELYAVNNLLQKDGTIEVDITIAGDRIAFEGKKYILVVREEQPEPVIPLKEIGYVDCKCAGPFDIPLTARGYFVDVINKDGNKFAGIAENMNWLDVTKWRRAK